VRLKVPSTSLLHLATLCYRQDHISNNQCQTQANRVLSLIFTLKGTPFLEGTPSFVATVCGQRFVPLTMLVTGSRSLGTGNGKDVLCYALFWFDLASVREQRSDLDVHQLAWTSPALQCSSVTLCSHRVQSGPLSQSGASDSQTPN